MKSKVKENIYNLFWIFMIASVVGWVIEGIWTYARKGLFINHSAVVIGPFNMAYGFSACFLTALLYRFRDKNKFLLFTIGFLGGSVLEYIMSYIVEFFVGFSAWDYSNFPFNIDGRICLRYSLFWGILSLLWIKYVYPKFLWLIKKVDFKTGKKITIGLFIFILFDFALSFSALDRAKAKDMGIPPQNKYEEILDKTFNKAYLKNMYNNRWRD